MEYLREEDQGMLFVQLPLDAAPGGHCAICCVDSVSTSMRKVGQVLFQLPLRSKKAERFEKLLRFDRSHYIVTRGSVSLSCATTPHPSCFSKS